MQEAVRDMERACAERDTMAGELAAKISSLHRSEKRRDACAQELNALRRENGAKIAVIAELQATGHSWAAKVRRWSLLCTLRSCAV